MFSFVSAESGTMPKPAARLPAGANVNHMRDERTDVGHLQAIKSFLIQYMYSITGHMPTEDSKIAAIAECLLQTPKISLFCPALHCNHSQGSFHPARIATSVRSVPQHASNARRNPTRDATRQFRILGKSFRATHELWCDKPSTNPAVQGSPMIHSL